MHRFAAGRFLLCGVFCCFTVLPTVSLARNVYRTKFEASGKYLLIEILDDHLAHFELSARLPGPNATDAIATTPMVASHRHRGPVSLTRSGSTIETSALRLEVDPKTLCIKYHDKIHQMDMTEICPLHLDQYWKGFTLTRGPIQNYYGLGQEFRDPGQADGDWMNRVRHYGAIHGNAMTHFNGGDNGNTQIPVLYALGQGKVNYALFLDQVYQQQWNFTFDPGKVEMYGDHIRWYLMSGPDLPTLRKTYMNLVGHPLVPPKKMFGLWVSEFGYRNWNHLEGKLASLRSNKFPVDGFMLDLFWFGGVREKDPNTSMGKLSWDTSKFPDASSKLAQLKNDEGVGVIPIEESYIGKNLPEHRELANRRFLVRDEAGQPASLDGKWWGSGGMIDWINPAAGEYWHQTKRLPLLQAGVAGHWVDLGEPEIFPTNAVYHKWQRQPDVHNLYNFHWVQGIFDGYQKYTPDLRPFILSRSGAAGIQRFGTVMWSGDIGADLTSLASHQNAQMHQSLSGIDYYGADIGGFHRWSIKGDTNEMYTQWFAYGSMFDIPVRPHTENLCECKETSPDRIGEKASNRENLRWRYRMAPYLYSLAHLAYRDAEPVFPPMVYHFQEDQNARLIGRQKMIGPWLLATAIAKYGENQTHAYLPQGKWFDFYTGEVFKSKGEVIQNLSLYPEGTFRLPLHARAGAIIPLQFIDDKTMNILGKRKDGAARSELIVRVFPDSEETSFILFEDDGISNSYQKGQVRETRLTQFRDHSQIDVSIDPSKGDYPGGVSARNHILEVFHPTENATAVLLNGQALRELFSLSEWEAASEGWFAVKDNRTLVKTSSMDVHSNKQVELQF